MLQLTTILLCQINAMISLCSEVHNDIVGHDHTIRALQKTRNVPPTVLNLATHSVQMNLFCYAESCLKQQQQLQQTKDPAVTDRLCSSSNVRNVY